MKPNISECVRENLQQYFEDLDGQDPANVYEMVIHLVEKPILEEIMERANHNQSRAAQWLGLNRNTLRKKLQHHALLDSES
ncbi:Fis family transcriptional regulator [Lampropedia puyangensis]|uniref:Putative Fis-like DNA-binding protein n=1 Tax=Lampropedia puyangensis TaxID=1330072 RepID=A0A4S8F5W2_9BURK|nr:Fis family transcriptional regulator [Lampropedia puyangensis]THU02499.1 Fis family transcriptional regulator [Lampropedia puyangensis]